MVFSSILNMLFSYQFFTFSQPFSQLQNKFRNRKFQYINLNKNQNKTFVKLKNSVKWREGGRASDRQLRERERQIEKERDRAWVGSRWCFRQHNLGGASSGAILAVLQAARSCRCWGAMRLMRFGVGGSGAIWGRGLWCFRWRNLFLLFLSLFYFPSLEII